MAQNDTKDTEQYMINRSYDPDYNVEAVLLVGEDSTNGVLRRLKVNSSGELEVTF
jgi:hypothetical protein